MDYSVIFVSSIGVIFSLFLLKGMFDIEYRKKPEEYVVDENIIISFKKIEDESAKMNFIRVLAEDYKIWTNNVYQRQTITLIVGTILLSSSFTILNEYVREPAGEMWGSASLSIGLYLFWVLVLHWTSRKFNAAVYDRLNVLDVSISECVGYKFGVNQPLNVIRQGNWSTKFRSLFWQLLLMLLSLIWLMVGVFSTYQGSG